MKIEKAFRRLWREVDQGNKHQVKAIKDLAIGLQQYEVASIFRDRERMLEQLKSPAITVKNTQWYLNDKPIEEILSREPMSDEEVYSLALISYLEQQLGKETLSIVENKRTPTIPNRD